MSMTLRRLWIQITADKRRFGILVAALGVGLLLWARIIVISQPPRRAMAEDGSRTTAKAPAPDKKSGEAVPKRESRTIHLRLAEAPTHNPFRISSDFFPRPTPALTPGKEEPKSTPRHAEDAVQAALRRERELRERAGRLKLEAVMKGTPVMAAINGRMYAEGDALPFAESDERTFVIREIRSRSVLLEHEGFVLELRMNFALDR